MPECTQDWDFAQHNLLASSRTRYTAGFQSVANATRYLTTLQTSTLSTRKYRSLSTDIKDPQEYGGLPLLHHSYPFLEHNNHQHLS
jgi:hypothetical protein